MTSEELRSEEPEAPPERLRVPADEPLPEILPVLPLRNTVLFPTLVAPMVATTERAKRLVDDALASDRLIVTVAARDPEKTEPGPDDLYKVGTAVRVLRMSKSDDGAQRLWVQGVRRVARQHEPVGADDDEAPSPAVHAALRIVGVVVGRDEQHFHFPEQALPSRRRDLARRLELLARRQERAAIDERPAEVLSVGELEAVGL